MSEFGSRVEVLSLFLAGAAFIVALVSLYLTNLKRAEIVVTLLPDQPPAVLSESYTLMGEEGRWPTGTELRVPLAIYNAGARTGVLSQIALEAFHEDPADPPLFGEYGSIPRVLVDSLDPYEPGTLRVHTLRVALGVMVPVPNLGELKNRLAAKDSVRVKLAWRYLKGRSLIPWRHHQAALVGDELLITVPLSQLAEDVALPGP